MVERLGGREEDAPDSRPSTPAERERTDVSVHALVTKSTAEAFEVWASRRGMKTSAAVRALITDALWRMARGEPPQPLYGDLPTDVAQRIVTEAPAPERAGEA